MAPDTIAAILHRIAERVLAKREAEHDALLSSLLPPAAADEEELLP